MPLFNRKPNPEPKPDAPAPRLRQLFLDDDPERARVFLEENPEAVWVQTAAECIAKLAEPWDEVHLDHDLGGEHYVDTKREDCGMEVVRWVSLSPRPHLQSAKFQVHSHNASAATLMVMQLMIGGFRVEARPFGQPPTPPPPDSTELEPPPNSTLLSSFTRFLRLLFLGRPAAPPTPPDDPGYLYSSSRTEHHRSKAPPIDLKDFNLDLIKRPKPSPPADAPPVEPG